MSAPGAPGPDGPTMVAGLGNPEAEYQGTRHNVGFAVAAVLAERVGARFSAHRKSGSDVAEGRLAGRRTILVRPRGYMNLSGGPVANALRFFSVPATDLVVVHDDLDLDFGVVRVKRGGGEGGHNGLRSVTKSVGTKDYLRVRVGIGRPPGRQDPADYVLKRWSSAERRDLDVILEVAADAVEALVTEGLA